MDEAEQPHQTKDWLEVELEDTLDEDYEIELEDAILSMEIRKIYNRAHGETIPRRQYFQSLLRLQAELIKLQDWVVHHKKRVVVLFEGRDAAGKGGVIKRITQRLNPRVCSQCSRQNCASVSASWNARFPSPDRRPPPSG